MPAKVQASDVLLYINSHEIVGTLSPESREAVVGGLQQVGYYTYPTSRVGLGSRGGNPQFTGPGMAPNTAVALEGNELSAEEQEAVLRVRTVIREKHRTLHIVDVGRESELTRYIQEHRHHLKRFPVLVRPDGRRLEGIETFTTVNLEAFLQD